MPGESDEYADLADRYRAQRRRKEELAMRRKALGAARGNAERAAALLNLADPLAYFGRLGEALKCLREAASLAPRSSVYWLNLAAYLIREGRPADGLDALRNLDDMAREDPSYWMWAGRAKRLLGRFEEAVEAFRRSVELNPNAEHAWRDLAMALVQTGRYQEAKEICSRRLSPGLASHLIRADIECSTGDHSEGCKLMATALEAMSGPEAFEEARWHYCNRRSHEELVAYVQQLAARMSDCPWPHWILARLLSVLEDRSTAAREVDELLRLAPHLRESLEDDAYLRRATA